MLLIHSISKFIQNLSTLDKSDETIRGYLNDLNAFNEFLERKYNRPLYLDELQSFDIEDFLYHLKEKGLKSTSRSRNLYTLRSFWNYMYKKNLCEKNIADEVEPIKLQKKERVYLTAEEIDLLIHNIDHSLIKLVTQTLFYTGMRISECLNLTLDQVDLSQRVIHIINGKGKKDRNIPIHHDLLPLLQSYLEKDRPKIDTPYFFITKKTGSLSAVYFNRVIKDTANMVGIKKNISAHILRHSFASNLIKNGVNLVHIQKLLGHSNLNVTSIYTHSNLEDLDQSINML